MKKIKTTAPLSYNVERDNCLATVTLEPGSEGYVLDESDKIYFPGLSFTVVLEDKSLYRVEGVRE